MRVTLMTDASVCDVEKVAGFGMWVVSQRGKLGYGDFIPKPICDSYIGEIEATIHSLATALVRELIQKGDYVLVQLDNQGAIDCLRFQNVSRPDAVEAQETWRKLIKAYDLTIELRHVKAHSRDKNMRFVSNNICDERAKRAMRLYREQVKAQREMLKGINIGAEK